MGNSSSLLGALVPIVHLLFLVLRLRWQQLMVWVLLLLKELIHSFPFGDIVDDCDGSCEEVKDESVILSDFYRMCEVIFNYFSRANMVAAD